MLLLMMNETRQTDTFIRYGLKIKCQLWIADIEHDLHRQQAIHRELLRHFRLKQAFIVNLRHLRRKKL